jgi:myo-inositol 2-dehydrogenase / D-chiro-inositol 1-dehydrogenase
VDAAELRVGIIGAGWIAATHRDTLERTEGARLVATADPVPGRAGYTDWRTMLDRERLDAVLVCTPPSHHREPAVAAADRGLAVYLEKPVAASLDDADAIAAAVSVAGVVCAVGYQYRVLRLPDGPPPRVLLGRGLSEPEPAAAARPWFGDPTQGGSQVLERASHLIDLERALAGEVVQVAGFEHGGIASLGLAFASGALGTVVVGAAVAGGAVGDGPMAGGTGAGGAPWALELVGDAGLVAVDLDPDPPPLRTSLERFLAAVRAGEPTAVACPVAEGVATLEVTLACELAVQSGSMVALGGGRLARNS